MKTNLDLSTIKVQLGGQNEPKDENLIELLKKAYLGELLVYYCVIKTEAIVRFPRDYRPIVSDEFRSYFSSMEEKQMTPAIFVYPKLDYFISSDDHNSLSLYLEKNYKEIPCVLLGQPDSSFVVEQSPPFKLAYPHFLIL